MRRRDRQPGTGDSTPGAAASEPGGIEIAIVTGLSGAGRSTAAKCLEDLGYYVVDNLPPELLATLVDLGSRSQGGVTRLAVVMDVRSRAFSSDLRDGHPRTRRARPCARACCSWRPRRRPGPPVRERPPRAPAAGRRPAGRRHRARAALLSRPARRRRPDPRHQRPFRPPAARRDRVGVRRAGGARADRRAAGHRGVVRLQVRAAGRRRPGRRRPLPAQPVLDPGTARPHRRGPRRSATTSWHSRTPRSSSTLRRDP